MVTTASLHLPNVLVVTNVGGDLSLQQQLLAEGEVYCHTVARHQLFEQLDSLRADVILLQSEELTKVEMGLLGDLKEAFVGVPIIIVSGPLEDAMVRRLLQIGVQDWLMQPVDLQQLHNSIHNWASVGKASNNKVHAIVSVHAGAGGTTLACNFASLQAQQPGHKQRRVALVDLDFSAADCSHYLGISQHLDFDAILRSPQEIDEEFIDLIKHEYQPGFYVYSYQAPAFALANDNSEVMLRLLDLISMSHETTFIDMPYYQQGWTKHVLGAVDSVTLVATNNIAGLAHTQALLQRLQGLRHGLKDVTVIINKQKRRWLGEFLNDKRVRGALPDVPVVFLPDDGNALDEALNQGLPLCQTDASSPLVKQMSGLPLPWLQPVRLNNGQAHAKE